MRVSVYDTEVVVDEATLDDKRKLTTLLSARPEGYQHTPAFRSGRWNGYICLYKQGKFPAGLLNLIQISFPDIVINDRRTDLIYKDAHTDFGDFQLRDYQVDAVDAVLRYGNGTLKMATNAGKTLVAASIITSLHFPQTIYAVPSKALLMQTSQDLSEHLNLEIGRFGAGYADKQTVTVTTLHSLEKLLKTDVKSNKLLIVDECHRTKSDKLFDRLSSVPARYRIGMSGTPLTYNKLSDMKLAAVTGPIIYEITNTELIDSGWSIPPEISFIKIGNGSEDKISYQEAYKRFVVGNIQRNARIASLAHSRCGEGKSVMIITNWIEHSDHIANFLADESGLIYLTGNSSKDDMMAGLDKFREAGGILLCTPIFSEGINIPDMSVLILAAAGKSHIQLLQRIGRGMRTANGKEVLEVIDFIDDTNKYLFKHSKKRYELYKEEGFLVKLL